MRKNTRWTVSILALILIIVSGGEGLGAQAGDNLIEPTLTSTYPPCTSQAYVYSVAVSHDDQWVLASLNLGEVRLWNIETGEVIRTFQHGKEGDLITNVAFS